MAVIDLTHSSDDEAEAERKAAETESDSDEGAGGSQADLESSQAQPRPPPCSPPADVVAQLQAVYDIDPVVSQEKQASRLDGQRIVMAGSGWSCLAMASTSPQAVASCARMRVVPIDHSASSEKPAKELGKGKQKAADGMGGSAKKPKTICHLEHLLTNAIRWHKSHGHEIVVNKDNKTSWIAAVSEWFETRKEQFDFLNINHLKPKTVQMMVRFEAELVVEVMDKCEGVQVTGKGSGILRGNSVVQDMQKFNAFVFDKLEHTA